MPQTLWVPLSAWNGSLGQVDMVSAGDRQINTNCVESECIVSVEHQTFYTKEITRNQAKYNPPSYSDAIQKECIHQKKVVIRLMPQKKEAMCKLVYCKTHHQGFCTSRRYHEYCNTPTPYFLGLQKNIPTCF